MSWWYSQNEERWNGPEDTREAAIQAGRTDYDGEQFMVCSVDHGEFYLRLSAYVLTEQIDYLNKEIVDSEGDACVFPMKITKEQDSDLEDLVEAAIRTWAIKNEFSLRAWSFENQSAIETIPEQATP